MKKRIVALYGTNLIMSSIGASLQQKPEFRVVRIEGSLEDYLEKMGEARPEAILFDLATAQAHFAVWLMNHYPEIMLVGVDLVSNKMVVLSVDASRLLTIEDLIQAIEKRSFSKALNY
jgi:DNA-binding NarL/FixJ family response regulator